MICKDDVYCKYNKNYIYDLYYKGVWTTKNNKDCKDNVCCKDIVVKVIVARGCCCEKMVNVDAEGWLMLMLEMLLQRTLLHAQDVVARDVAKLGHCYKRCYNIFFAQDDCYHKKIVIK